MQVLIDDRLYRIRLRKAFRAKMKLLRQWRRDRTTRAIREHCPTHRWSDKYGKDPQFGLKVWY